MLDSLHYVTHFRFAQAKSYVSMLKAAGRDSTGIKEIMLANYIEEVAMWAVGGSPNNVAMYLYYFDSL